MKTVPQVELKSFTNDADTVVANAAALCHGKISSNPKGMISHLLRRNHLSPFEHAVFQFDIKDISRACSHQLVRYRIASPTQESQRHVEPNISRCVIPPSIKTDEQKNIYKNATRRAFKTMRKLIELGVPLEDARYVLPNATGTRIALTMNARSLLNFFSQRCCKTAQWEIRNVAFQMLKLVREVAPAIFSFVGAPCSFGGGCRENEPCAKD